MSIYEQLGVKQYINGTATITKMGGSRMPQEVLDAMNEAARSFVSIVELQQKAGARIAELTGNEAAMVPNGAASGMLLATAVCIAEGDPEKLKQLPFSDGMKNEVLVYSAGRVGYEFAIRIAGGKIIPYGSPEGATEAELEAAINEKTAAIFIFYFEHRMDTQLSVPKVVEIGHRHGIPVIVDAAAQLPARENLWRFTREWGADLAIFSGGKGLCGPQSSGLAVGKKWLIDQMIENTCPNLSIGRAMKVGKEEIVGLLKAVELYMAKDMEAEMKDWEDQVQSVIDAFADDPALKVDRDFPSEAGQPMPRAKVTLNQDLLAVDAKQIAARLEEGDPAILVAPSQDALLINPQTLDKGEMAIIIEKLKEAVDYFKSAR